MILAIANQKGGVGKTSTAQTLAAGLNNQKKKTLLIDLDPQCNLTYSCGVDPDETKVDIADLLEKKATAKDAIIHTAEGDFIPGNYLLTDADLRFGRANRREYLLSDAIKPVLDEYKFIIIDCPPTIGLLTTNAFVIADSVLIPVEAGIYSFQGLGQLNNAILNVKRHCNNNLVINGLLLTRCRNTGLDKQAKEAVTGITEKLKTKAYKTIIRESIIVRKSQLARESVLKYSPRSNVAKDYEAFISEFLKGVKKNGK